MITVFGEGRGFRVVWLLEEMGLQVGREDARPFACHRDRRRLSDPLPGRGDQRRLAFQTFTHVAYPSQPKIDAGFASGDCTPRESELVLPLDQFQPAGLA